MRNSAKFGLPFLVVVTAILWISAKHSPAEIFVLPAASLAQLAGLLGVVALGWNFLLASRFLLLDQIFGGLDKVFREHRRAGSFAFTFMLAHPLLMVVNIIPHWEFARTFLLPGDDATLNAGLFALWSFTVLILLTIAVRLPYHIWKMTHRLMGLPFALVAYHVATIPSDVAMFLPLRIWTLGLITIGLGCYLWKALLYPWFGPRYQYRIDEVRQLGDVVEAYLKPLGKVMRFRSGQFVFIGIQDSGVGREEHPFSVSSAPGDDRLRLSMKKVGDYTKRLGLLRAGVEVRVFGPYGQFAERAFATGKPGVWIAGGIGVTPFLSMLKERSQEKADARIAMFYCTKNSGEALYDDEIARIARHMPNLAYHQHHSDLDGYISAEEIARRVGDLKERLILLCGPTPMMRKLQAAFLAMGVPPRNIVFEDFSLR